VTDLSYCDWNNIRTKLEEYEDVRFIAAGGDGTLRLVLEQLWKEDLLRHCTVGFIPLGSANMAAVSFRLPFGLLHALKKTVEGTPRAIDLGVINNTYVFFIAAFFGVASNVTIGAHRGLKKKWGWFAYVLSIEKLIHSNYQRRSFIIEFEENGQKRKIRSHSMIVCNQLNIGGLKPLRGIRPDDNHLHLITLHNTSPWGFLQAVYDFFRGRKDTGILRHKRFTHTRYTLKNFKGAVHLDGDAYIDLGDTLEFCVLPRAAKLVM
tara:strand:+ start:25920 stop:26708 length:789 start_codon:yes stop_codon:yes gene_type:complete